MHARNLLVDRLTHVLNASMCTSTWIVFISRKRCIILVTQVTLSKLPKNPRRVVIFVQLDQRCFIIVLFAISVCALVVLNIHHLLLLRIPRLTSTHLVFLQAKSRLLAIVVELKATTLNLTYVSSAILSSMEIVSTFLAS
ncbi:hypothetical protein YC2023_038135 [Brassica napus]